VIGFVGTTGNAPESTPHLHFAVEDLPRRKSMEGNGGESSPQDTRFSASLISFERGASFSAFV